MKHPVLVVLGVATAVAGVAVAVVQNRKSAAELPQKSDPPKRILHRVSDIMREQFGSGPGQHDPSEATAGD